MLDKTEQGALDAALDVPAISVQIASTIGGTRSLTLTTGIPLDCTTGDLNKLLDKLTAASDRQKKKHDLEQTKALLKNEEQNLHLHRQQLATQNAKFQTEYNISGRKGDWQPKGGQKSVLDGLQGNIENSEKRIRELREAIVQMEKECL